jgi:hypothetical protein
MGTVKWNARIASLRTVMGLNFVTGADINFLSPVRNVIKLIRPQANFATNAGTIPNSVFSDQQWRANNELPEVPDR